MINFFTNSDIEFLRDLMQQASKQARQIFAAPAADQAMVIKKDHSLVSKADKQIEHFLREKLSQRFPHIDIVGEEQGGKISYPCWAIDPIDGTSSFISGLSLWTISLGFINEKAQPQNGFVAIPMTRDLIWQDTEQKLYLNNNILFTSTNQEYKQKLINPANQDFYRETQCALPSGFHQKFIMDQKFLGKVRSLGSTAIHGSLTATGQLDIAFIGRPKLWDIAAAWSHLKAAGKDLYFPENASLWENSLWVPVDIHYFDLPNDQKPILIAGKAPLAAKFASFIHRI